MQLVKKIYQVFQVLTLQLLQHQVIMVNSDDINKVYDRSSGELGYSTLDDGYYRVVKLTNDF